MVNRRIVSGERVLIKASLAAHGWQINTAFIERFNLTLRQQGLALARLADRRREQLGLGQVSYNFCLPHRSLGDRQQPVTPAMAGGLTDRVWGLAEILLIQEPIQGQLLLNSGSQPAVQLWAGKNCTTGIEAADFRAEQACIRARFGFISGENRQCQIEDGWNSPQLRQRRPSYHLRSGSLSGSLSTFSVMVTN